MQKYFLAIVLVIAGLCACEKHGGPGTQSASNVSRAMTNLNVKVRIGVVMKSGDVKRVARRDVLVMRADIIALWADVEKAKKQNLQAQREIIQEANREAEQEVKREMGYDAKLNSFRAARNEASRLSASRHQLLSQGCERIAKLIERTCQASTINMIHDFDTFSDNYRPEEWGRKENRERLRSKYEWWVENNKYFLNPPSDEDKKFMTRMRDELDEIYRSFPEEGTILREEERQIEGTDREQREFMGTFNRAVSERAAKKAQVPLEGERVPLEKAKTEFLQKVREAFVLSFKTDLEGEASVAMPKGRCFLFCDADVGLSHVTWSCPVEVTQEGQLMELSNDNAAAVDGSEVAQLISTIGTSGAK